MATRTQPRIPTSLPASFDRLVRLSPPMAIHDNVQHGNFVEIIDRLMQVESLTPGQADYLETLVQLVEAYEAKRHAIDASARGGLRMLHHVLEQSGLSRSDLARLLKVHATMGSKLFNGERRLTWEHAKVLADHFKVAPALFMD